MPVSDAAFMECFNRHRSPQRVAEELGINVRNVHRRRRVLEKKHETRLAVIDSRPSYDQSALITADRVECKLKITDGVVLVSGDQHFWPGHVPVMHKALLKLAKQMKPYAIVWNGDAFDGAGISRWPDIGWESKPTVQQELEAVQSRADEVLKASPNSVRVWCAGNHDLRFESRLAAVASQYANVKGLHLKDHIPQFLPAWFVTVNDGEPSHTEIRHREKGGVHASYNNTLTSGVTIVTGHDHIADVKAYDDRRGRRYGVRHGMGADSARGPQFVNYLEGRKPSWQSGLAVLTYRAGRLLQPELALRVDDETFEFRGELFKI